MSKKSKKLHEPSMEDINAATLAALTKLDKLGVIDTEDPDRKSTRLNSSH